MILDTLRHRYEFFAAVDPEILQPVATRVAAGARSLAGTIPAGPLAAIKADLTYAVARHHHWRGAPILVDVLTDFLVREYRLTNDAAMALSLAAVAPKSLPAHGTDGHVAATDREFLRYIFVASATATCEAELLADLGIGTALVARIRETVEATVAARTADAPVRFLPELDAHISEILCELASEAKSVPWALAVHRLRYHLIDATAPLSPWLKVHGARALFDLLLAIGSRGTASLRQIALRLRRIGKGCEGRSDEAGSLLRALAAEGLVFLCDVADDEERRRYQLTPFAQELTAEAFARNLTITMRTPLAEFGTLCAPYQAAVIRALEVPDVETLTRIAESTRPLSPLGLRAALDRVREVAGVEAATLLAARTAAADASPWLRRAAEQYLAAKSA